MTPKQDPTALHFPDRGGLLIRFLGALIVGGIIVACIILPAEFHRDPTGLGALTGLMAMSEPPPVDKPASTALAAKTDAASAARAYQVPFRTDDVDIPLRPDGELEYKVRMQPGGTLVYSWKVEGGSVYYDFHGEPPDDPNKSQSYGTGVATSSNGSLIAPFAGIHGWFLQNQEGTPVHVKLRMSGYYEMRESQTGK